MIMRRTNVYGHVPNIEHINYRADVTTACYVEYGGVKYNVNRIDNSPS